MEVTRRACRSSSKNGVLNVSQCRRTVATHSGSSDDAVLGTTDLDSRPFASVAGAGRVAGTQFHPEKSGPAGRELLRAFLRWSDRAA